MAPAATFAVYALKAALSGSESLDTVQAFTSLALISLIVQPASRLLHAIPNTARSIGSFDRIQAFLILESRVDGRLEPGRKARSLRFNGPNVRPKTMNSDFSQRLVLHEEEDDTRSFLAVRNGHIRPSRESEFALKNVNISIRASQVVMMVGPIGSGKTTLIRTFLGEIELVQGAMGTASVRVGYCAQSPWLINGTIKEAICGCCDDDTDETWYNTVLEACALRYDIANLSDGDQTIIGSRGTTLSGGQKQRIALARAIYSRPQLFLLDDTLSALDSRTETEIMTRLFKKDGMFRKMGSTIVLVTHAGKYVIPRYRIGI